MKRTITALTLLALLLAACRGSGGPTPDPSAPDADTAVLRVDVRGGLVGPDFPFAQLPSFLLLGDGRVLQPGAIEAIFPGPLLAPLEQRRLSADGMRRILAEVAATGLFDTSREFRGAPVADAPDTIFTLRTGDRVTVISINALGLVDGPGLSAEEARAHQALGALSNRLMGLEQWLPASAWTHRGSQPYRPDAYRLLLRETDANEREPTGIGFNLAAWPGRTGPDGGVASAAFGGRCLVVSGDEAQRWTAAIGKANQLTRWTTGGRRYLVMPRPLLPGEPRECPGA
ncbi:MAG TPA: hypothetical protein VFN14_02380 [Candidatus Limnocylindria bacterium]|nr:hypothetical protein [Candidatus Limnocylindria bacterium]